MFTGKGAGTLRNLLTFKKPKVINSRKAPISTLVFNTKIDREKKWIITPGHITKKLNAIEMMRMKVLYPKHSITQSGGWVGFGPNNSKSLASRQQEVQIENLKMNIGTLVKDLSSDSNRNMKTYGTPDAVHDHGTLTDDQIHTLVKTHDHIASSDLLYRTDVSRGYAFGSPELDKRRTINCVGADELLSAPLGGPPVTDLNTTPQQRGAAIANLKVGK